MADEPREPVPLDHKEQARRAMQRALAPPTPAERTVADSAADFAATSVETAAATTQVATAATRAATAASLATLEGYLAALDRVEQWRVETPGAPPGRPPGPASPRERAIWDYERWADERLARQADPRRDKRGDPWGRGRR